MYGLKSRLLVLDDDPQLRRVYSRLLAPDFSIECEANPERALQRIEDGSCFDVILCDRNLGTSMSGQDFYELVSCDLQERIVMCSGDEPDVDDAFARALGDRFFVKCGELGALVQLLRRVARAAPSPRAAA